jgi:hypothetical protein
MYFASTWSFIFFPDRYPAMLHALSRTASTQLWLGGDGLLQTWTGCTELGELISCNEAAMRCSTPRQRGQSDIINLARIKEATEVSALWIIYKALRPRHQPWCVWREPRRADRRNREGFRELKKLQYSVQEVAGKVWPTATICRRCTHLLKQQSSNLGRLETAAI